jgi:hypothetical protein
VATRAYGLYFRWIFMTIIMITGHDVFKNISHSGSVIVNVWLFPSSCSSSFFFQQPSTYYWYAKCYIRCAYNRYGQKITKKKNNRFSALNFGSVTIHITRRSNSPARVRGSRLIVLGPLRHSARVTMLLLLIYIYIYILLLSDLGFRFYVRRFSYPRIVLASSTRSPERIVNSCISLKEKTP